eukprot:5378-Prymnesium_polylepis.2
MRPAAYAVDGGCKACERTKSGQLCAPGLCKACRRQMKAARHQGATYSSEEVGCSCASRVMSISLRRYS